MSDETMILAGDIGGTKTYLGRFTLSAGTPVPVEIKSYRTLDFPGLESMVHHFLDGQHDIQVAAFGIPGPVVKGQVDVTNVPWSIHADRLARELKVSTVHLVNDLVATGYGAQILRHGDLLTLNAGCPVEDATQALIAAGTGLGECVLHTHAGGRTVLPCEAGQAAFAPHDALQCRLLQHLMKRLPYVCVERVISGPGLVIIYEFLRDTDDCGEKPSVAQAMREADPAAVIASHAEAESDELCVRAMRLFLRAYGSEAGNLAIRNLALGGVYVGGGIAPKIANLLRRGDFMKAFIEKECMEEMLSNIPVHIILEDRTALFGAALMASHFLSTT